MTTDYVRRATMVLCGVFIAAAVAFAWLAESRTPSQVPLPVTSVRPASPAGAPVFESRCGACHSAEEIVQLIHDAPDRRAKQSEIELLLSSHGDASADEVRKILGYLEDLEVR